MNQIFTLLFASLLLFSSALAQSTLAFQDDTVMVLDVDPNLVDATIYFNVVNVSDGDVSVSAERINNITEGHGSFFCWDLCYDTVANASGDPITIAAGDTTKFAQYVTLRPNNIEGFSEVTMIFVDLNSGDFLQRTYRFQVGAATSISAPQSSRFLAYPYPQGQRGLVKLPYVLPAATTQGTLAVRDLSGRLVSRIDLRETRATLQLNTTDWKAGLYLLSLEADGQVYATQKLDVSP